MTPDSNNSEGPNLSDRQAALNSNIGAETLLRLMEDEEFHDSLEEIRQQVAESASLYLQDLMPRCVAVLSQALQNPEPAIRLEAAHAVLVCGSKLLRYRELEDRQLTEGLQPLSDALPPGPLSNPAPDAKAGL